MSNIIFVNFKNEKKNRLKFNKQNKVKVLRNFKNSRKTIVKEK